MRRSNSVILSKTVYQQQLDNDTQRDSFLHSLHLPVATERQNKVPPGEINLATIRLKCSSAPSADEGLQLGT